MASIFNEQEQRLRELNGVLDMALLLATDVIVEAESHGLSKAEWQRRLISTAARKLADVQQFAGRFSLFTDEELQTISEGLGARDEFDGIEGAESASAGAVALGGEVEFEMTRRGLGKLQQAVI